MIKGIETTAFSTVIKAEELTVRRVFDAMAAAWNAGDATAFGKCLTDDCDYVTFAGQHIRGRQANEQIHRELFDSWIMSGSTMHVGKERPSVVFLSPAIALVHSTGTVQLRFQKEPPPDRLSIQTTVLVKTAGDWKVRAFHNNRIRRPGFLQRILMSLKRR
ncbi:SgcJ/EcaC family oxidoreductase [Spirosoma koreense]